MNLPQTSPPALAFKRRFLIGLLLFSCALIRTVSAAPQLQVAADGTNVVLAWPTNAVGFRAQSRIGLSVAESWSDLEATAASSNALQYLVLPRTNSPQFFRLFKDAGTNPSVQALVVSTNAVAFGATATLGFDIIEPDVDLAALVLTWTNVLGSFSNVMSATSIGLTGVVSRADLPIRPEKLPVGTSHFTLRLVDRAGLYSEPVYFQITVVGQGGTGTAPQLLSVIGEAAAWQPSFNATWRLQPGFTLNWSDPESDLERIRATLRMPSGESVVKELRAARAGFAGAAGTNVLRPFSLTYLDGTGTYLAEFQLIDHTGRTSVVHSAQFDLDYSAPAPPEITGFNPGSGPPGSQAFLLGNNLGSLGPNFQVTLAGVPCPIITNQFGAISLLVPTGAVTAPFKLSTAAQVSSSASSFVVPPFITLTADRDEAAPGEPVQFSTFIRGATNRGLTFSVNGVAGGNAAVGLISSNGLYRLPLLPTTNQMTIIAALTTHPSVTATALVQVLAPGSLGGVSWISAAQGGAVSTTEGDAALDVPPGALATNAILGVAVLRGTNAPPAATGRRLLGAVRLEPDGMVFNQPVTVTVPLAEARPPGTILALKYFIRATGAWVDEGLTAVVAANGREASGTTLHFSEVGVDETENVVAGGPPQITNVRFSTTLQESMTVPVLITGQNLVPGLRVELRRAGQPTSDVIPSNAIFETNRLGLLLRIATLRDLNFGSLRDYELRLVNSSNQFASAMLSVQGLDEMIIPPGAQTNVSSSAQFFSEVNVGAGAVVTAPSGLAWFVNGPVYFGGRIHARGENGAPSADTTPGINPAMDFDRRGGDGGLPDQYGGDGFLQLSTRGDFYYGDGGAPGDDINFIEDFFSAILNLVSCLSGSFISCGELVLDVIEIVGEIGDMDAGKAVGRTGLPGARAGSLFLADDGHGGGGGGGGGDLNWVDSGEAGGAGGFGGRGVAILTRGDLLLEGPVDTRGGDGGAGGENIVTTYHHSDGSPFMNLSDTPSANRGGGGGGGSGGDITLLARAGFRISGEGYVDARGGNPGNSLFRFRSIDVNSGLVTSERKVRFGEANYPITPAGRLHTQGAIVPARSLPDLVTDRGLWPVQLPPAVSAFVPPVTITIRGENTNQVREIPFTTGDSGFRRANLLFFPGFNTVAVNDGRVPDHAMLYRHVLYLAGPDSDGDGLSDADEAVVGSNPLVVDTDSDGMSDFDEVGQGLNPTTDDSDGDLLSDPDELSGGTNPRQRDSDADGFWDGWEIQAGRSPLFAQSTIPLLPAGTVFAEVISSLNGRVLAVVDPVTGKMAALGRVNNGLGFGIAFTADGHLLASQGDRLVRLLLDRPANASGQLAVTNIGNFRTNGPAIYCYSLAPSPYAGMLLGIESTAGGDSTGQFLSIDPLTGAATRMGLVQPQALRALAVLRSGSPQELLFAVSAPTGAPDALLSFPAGTTNGPQSLGSLNWTNVYGLTAAAADRLYAARTGLADSQLMLINTTNSTMTTQSTLSAPVFDLAQAPCPVPCFNGPFLSPLMYPGSQFETADFNGDTRPDLAVAVTRTVGSDQFAGVTIMHGRDDGTFTNTTSYFFINARDLGLWGDLALADVNGDGRTDIVVMQSAVIVGFFQTLIRPAELMVLLANNQGGFQTPVIQAMPSGAPERLNRITAADWSGDGLADLIFVNETLRAYTFQGNGAGLFTNAVALLPNTQINAALLADVNADGRPDFLGGGYELNVRLADGAGGFLPNQNFSGSGGTYISVGNVDGDADLDVVTTDYGAMPTVFYNSGAGSFPTNATFNPRNFPFGVYGRAALGDLSDDGRADAVVPSFGTKITAYISEQTPVTLAHTMQEPIAAPFEAGSAISDCLLIDVNHDGLLDAVLLGGNAISVLLREPAF